MRMSLQNSPGSHAAVLPQGSTTHMSKVPVRAPTVMASDWHEPAWVQSLASTQGELQVC